MSSKKTENRQSARCSRFPLGDGLFLRQSRHGPLRRRVNSAHRFPVPAVRGKPSPIDDVGIWHAVTHEATHAAATGNPHGRFQVLKSAISWATRGASTLFAICAERNEGCTTVRALCFWPRFSSTVRDYVLFVLYLSSLLNWS